MISSVKIPAAWKMKNNTALITTDAAAAIAPAVMLCLKVNFVFILNLFLLLNLLVHTTIYIKKTILSVYSKAHLGEMLLKH